MNSVNMSCISKIIVFELTLKSFNDLLIMGHL